MQENKSDGVAVTIPITVNLGPDTLVQVDRVARPLAVAGLQLLEFGPELLFGATRRSKGIRKLSEAVEALPTPPRLQ